MRIRLAALLSLVLVGTATAGGSTRSVVAPGSISALAADKTLVAYATGDEARRRCDRVRIWNVQTRRVVTLGTQTACDVGSTGRGIAALSLAGNRALWLHYVGGNIREWSLYTATTTRLVPRQLQFIPRDVEETAPIVIGKGDASRYGDLLPYAVGSQVVALTASGRRALSWRAPARVTALGANGGALAVASADGTVTAVDASGHVELEWAGTPAASATFVTGTGVVAQRGRTLEFATGSGPRKTFGLPRDARLQDAYGFHAVYVEAGRVYVLNLETGATRFAGRGTAAQLEVSRLVTATGRRVTAAPAR